MKKILVPVDFSPASENAVEWAASLAKDIQASLYLLHVYNEPAPVMEAGIPVAAMAVEVESELRQRMKTKAKALAEKHGIAVQGEAITGFVGDTINETAGEWNADVVCVGRKARKRSPLFGSTVLKAIRKTAVPVLVIPEGALYHKPHNLVLAVDFKEALHNQCMAPLLALVNVVDAAVHVLHVAPANAEVLPEEVPAKLQLGRALAKLTYHFEQVAGDDVGATILNFVEAHPTDLLVMTPHRHSLFARLFGERHTAPLAFETTVPLLVLKNER